MQFTYPVLNVYLRMRWAVFLAVGGEGNWHSKFRWAHPCSYLSPERRHGWKRQQNISPSTLPLSPALGLEKLCRKGDSVSLTRSTWPLMSSCESTCQHKVPAGAQKLCLLLGTQPAGSLSGWWGYRSLLSSWGALCLDPGSTGTSCLCRLWLLV